MMRQGLHPCLLSGATGGPATVSSGQRGEVDRRELTGRHHGEQPRDASVRSDFEVQHEPWRLAGAWLGKLSDERRQAVEHAHRNLGSAEVAPADVVMEARHPPWAEDRLARRMVRACPVIDG